MEDENEVRAYLVRELGGRDEGDISAPPWAPHQMGTDDGYVITTESNGVFIDASIVDTTIMFSMIHVARQRQGFGTLVMEALRRFANERGLAIMVYEVHNRAFFDTFDWLDDNYRSTFGPPDPYASYD